MRFRNLGPVVVTALALCAAACGTSGATAGSTSGATAAAAKAGAPAAKKYSIGIVGFSSADPTSQAAVKGYLAVAQQRAGP